jgi:hypothetical protein
MAVDDYPSGLNVRRHQNKPGTAIGPSVCITKQQEVIFGRPSPLVLLRQLYRCPEHLNPLQQFVLTCAMFFAALLAHPIHFSIDVLLLTHDATPARGNGWPSENRR